MGELQPGALQKRPALQGTDDASRIHRVSVEAEGREIRLERDVRSSQGVQEEVQHRPRSAKMERRSPARDVGRQPAPPSKRRAQDRAAEPVGFRVASSDRKIRLDGHVRQAGGVQEEIRLRSSPVRMEGGSPALGVDPIPALHVQGRAQGRPAEPVGFRVDFLVGEGLDGHVRKAGIVQNEVRLHRRPVPMEGRSTARTVGPVPAPQVQRRTQDRPAEPARIRVPRKATTGGEKHDGDDDGGSRIATADGGEKIIDPRPPLVVVVVAFRPTSG
mmetsp:Transcript_23234/g.54954  ORF Transcript_23234/g.54954 Transcript_23234/m.54954 type:complete len:273 (+) Transcript_23234:279-1097(+)